MIVVLLIFIVTIVIGLPIAYVLGTTGVIHAIIMNESGLFTMIPQRMYAGVNNFSLMAIPLFILAGEIMGFGGITEKLVNMMRSFVGHIKGGLAYSTVLVGTALGALLGSANASAALMGDLLYPQLIEDGYDDGFSASLIGGTSLLGPLIPPSMIFIIYGVAANVSVAKLFFGGIVPGILMALGFFFLIGIYAKRNNLHTHRKATAKERLVSVGKAIPALLVPIVILGGILTGMTTATESAATASFIALIVGTFVYKKLKWEHIPKILERTGVMSAGILMIVAMSNILGWTMALDQIPALLAGAFLSITNNKLIMLFIVNVFLLFVGMVMETTAAIIILVPVLLPVMTSVGVDPLHFGMIMSVNMIIGLLSPPVGVALYTTANVCGVSSATMIKRIWPWLGVAITVLFLITYFPAICTFLPNLLIK